jgi:hypothetical protein
MFGTTPASELGIPRGTSLAMAADLACATAVWTFENYLTEQAEEKAGTEASIIDKELSKYRESLSSRGN